MKTIRTLVNKFIAAVVAVFLALGLLTTLAVGGLIYVLATADNGCEEQRNCIVIMHNLD